MKRTISITMALFMAALAAGPIACGGYEGDDEAVYAETEDELSRFGVGANGDDCTVRTNPDGTKVPGKEKDGECCATSDPNDCVIILKPFPGFGGAVIRR